MKNKIRFMVLGLLLGLSALVGLTSYLDAAARCEKCSKGADGKIVCTPVPCP